MKTAITLAALPGLLRKLIELAEIAVPGGTGAEKKAFVVDFVNDKIDLPKLSEEQEAQLFGFGFDLLVGLVKS